MTHCKIFVPHIFVFIFPESTESKYLKNCKKLYLKNYKHQFWEKYQKITKSICQAGISPTIQIQIWYIGIRLQILQLNITFTPADSTFFKGSSLVQTYSRLERVTLQELNTFAHLISKLLFFSRRGIHYTNFKCSTQIPQALFSFSFSVFECGSLERGKSYKRASL